MRLSRGPGFSGWRFKVCGHFPYEWSAGVCVYFFSFLMCRDVFILFPPVGCSSVQHSAARPMAMYRLSAYQPTRHITPVGSVLYVNTNPIGLCDKNEAIRPNERVLSHLKVSFLF